MTNKSLIRKLWDYTNCTIAVGIFYNTVQTETRERYDPMNSKTLMYILKRIALAVLTVWVVITVTFFVMRAVPGGPFMSEKAISETAQAALEAKYGLDKPVPEQYLTYLKDIFTEFDFGPSLKLRGRDVIDIIGDGMKVSAKLGIMAACIALVVGVVLGAVAALRRNKFIDKCIMVLSTAFVAMPSFVIATFYTLVIYICSSLKIPACAMKASNTSP